MLKISEDFYSIQGEGAHQGSPAHFIRLAGCPTLPHCLWCDTPYSLDSSQGKDYSIEEVAEKVGKSKVRANGWICITGGEPLWQEPELKEFVEKLKMRFYKVEIFTNGMYKPPRWWSLVDSWVVDMKCPSSGICGISNETWYSTLRYSDQIKFTVSDKKDLEWSRLQIEKHRHSFNGTFIVSPVINNAIPGSISLNEVELAKEVVEFCKEEGVIFSLQWHKLLWGNRKGV